MDLENTHSELPRALHQARDQYLTLRYEGPAPSLALEHVQQYRWWPKAVASIVVLLGVAWGVNQDTGVVWEAEPSPARQIAELPKLQRPSLPDRPTMPRRPARAPGFAAEEPSNDFG